MAKAQGASHKETGKPCQDSAIFFVTKDKTAGIVAVADGHGSEKYFRSDKGSKLAVDITQNVLWKFYKLSLPVPDKSNPIVDEKKETTFLEKNIKRIEQDIIHTWRKEVLNDKKRQPFTEDEKLICLKNKIDFENEDDIVSIYGTTLLAALVTQKFWFGIQIGDGLCIIITKKNTAQIAMPLDDQLSFGKTTSLCNPDAFKNFKHILGMEGILGITVATDGVVDSFEPEKYLNFNIDLRNKFIAFPQKAGEDLPAFLVHLSEIGSRDDVAIAGIFKKPEETL